MAKHKGPLANDDIGLRIRPDEKVPPPGHRESVRVPDRDWKANNQRRDSAGGHADEEPPTE